MADERQVIPNGPVQRARCNCKRDHRQEDSVVPDFHAPGECSNYALGGVISFCGPCWEEVNRYR